VAIFSLALGIGGMTVAFSYIDPIVLRTLPVPHANELVMIRATRGDIHTFMPWLPARIFGSSWLGLPVEEFEQMRQRNHVLTGIFAYNGANRSVRLQPQDLELQMEAASGGFFSTLEISPEYGRFFTEEDERSPAWVAVISDRLWRRAFAQDPDILGKLLTLKRFRGDSDFRPTIIGVAPESFQGIDAGTITDVWILERPKVATGGPMDLGWWGDTAIVGRLRPGIRLRQAKQELDGIHRQAIADWAAQYGSD
jgi:hypothetical protein